MTNKLSNEEILKKAIEKAVKNGWLDVVPKKLKHIDFTEADIEGRLRIQYLLPDSRKIENYSEYIANRVIFSHDFAKAFWGEEEVGDDSQCPGGHIGHPEPIRCQQWWAGNSIPAWQYHLQIMVLEPDPIKYLEKFL